LCRSLVESTINCLYVKADPEARARAFVHSITPDVQKLAEKLRRTSPTQEVLEAFEKAEQLTKQAGWPRTVRERLQAIPEPDRSTYDLLFTMLSQVVHSSVSSVSGMYSQDQSGISIALGPSRHDIELALMIVIDFFRVIAFTAFQAFEVD